MHSEQPFMGIEAGPDPVRGDYVQVQLRFGELGKLPDKEELVSFAFPYTEAERVAEELAKAAQFVRNAARKVRMSALSHG